MSDDLKPKSIFIISNQRNRFEMMAARQLKSSSFHARFEPKKCVVNRRPVHRSMGIRAFKESEDWRVKDMVQVNMTQ